MDSTVILDTMYLAIDIGGTKTLLAIFSNDGKIVQRHKFATPLEYADFLKTLQKELKLLRHHDFERIVVAVPARLDHEHGVAVAFGNRPWERVPIRKDLEHILQAPVILGNDAKLAGLSEALLITHEFRKVLYITISTGINSALIIDGKLDRNTLDSEAGQLLLEYNGRLTDWEDFGSGRAFQTKFGKRVSDITDPHAWYYIARNIAIGLVDLMATYMPEVIVLGGGVGQHLDKFEDRLLEELKIYENPMLPIPAIRKAQRAEEAVIYGCYEVASRGHI